MPCLQSIHKKTSEANTKHQKGSDEGKIYEKLSLALLAKRGYELSTDDNSKICDFTIGREVGIGKEGKFDDVVFKYIDKDNTNNLIFVQIKHKQDYYQIDSEVLSAEASRAKGGTDGGLRRDFNLQKYFISFLNVREELRSPVSEELVNGKLNYVVIFTNIGLNTEELNSKGFNLKKAPHDIIKLFSLNEPSLKTRELNYCHQLDDVSEDLHKIFKRSSDLHRLARKLAQYVVWGNYREKNILGIDEYPIKHHHIALEREVIKKSDQVKNKCPGNQNVATKQYCEAQFRDDFLDNDESGSKQELRDALFETVRELDESKKTVSNVELKKVLKEVKLKVVLNFGKSKQNIQTVLPCKWVTVANEDITDFLKCLVFIINQPRVKELETIFRSSAQETAVEGTSLRQILDKVENTGPEFRRRIEKVLGIGRKTKYKEKWISGENIVSFIEDQKQLISISFIVTAMTLIYENDLIRYGKFNQLGKLEEMLDTFLISNSKVLCVNTSVTLLSSIKVLQFLNTKENCRAENGRISICVDVLNCKENRDNVSKAFQLESNNLLTVECRHYVKEQDLGELCKIARYNPNKKVILIIQQDECTILPEKYGTDYQNEGQYIILEKDIIDLKYFEPEEDPFKKEIIIFQGQEKKVSLATLTGISCWNSYVEILSQARIQEGQDIIDAMTLVEIFSNDEIEVGSKPLETNNLDGAYAIVFEEINPKSLANKLISQEPVIKTDEIFVISGISEWNKAEKGNKLIQYLGLVNEQKKIKNQLGDIGSDSRIQIADDEFKDEDFKQICLDYPEKMISWIFIKHENSEIKFILQQFYNPEFYIKRKFKNVVISKGVKEQLLTESVIEIFIFYSVNNEQEFTDLFENQYEKVKIENNCKKGKILLFSLEDKARTAFQKVCEQHLIVHLLRIEEKQFIWCNSHLNPGTLNNLRRYIDHEQSEISVVEEDNLITEIKDKKIVIIADDPGMGKTTTLTKFHESKNHTASFTETHWILRVNLKDHLEAVRDVELKCEYFNVLNVVNFLSKVDLKLNHKLAKNLLRVSLLDQNNKNTKPLLLAFDGFDEVLDEVDREKIILLLTFLKNKTSAKIWITTRLHYKEILEFKFSCFAIQFDPLDDDSKVAYIKKYLKDRMCLILSEKKFAEVFDQNDEMQENESIKIYVSEFLNKIKSVFKSNTYKFIGTPLQLYLMLEGSISHFRYWVEKCQDQIPNFDYLGTDVGEVYKNFLNRKYDVYFKKMGIKKGVRQKQDKFMFNQYNKAFAKSLVLNSQSKKPLEKFKQVVLSAGIIKSNGTNIEFIHTTFRDYFSAKVFVQWIKKVPNELLNLSKHKFLLQVIFKKPDYQQIRIFIDLKLKKVAETESFKESVKHYGVIVEQLLIEEENSLMDDNGTALGLAVEEGNKNIVRFFLKSLKENKDVLKKFLFHRTATGKSALDLVFVKHDIEVIRILLDAASEISDDTLQELLYFSDTIDGYNILDTAALWCKNFEIFKELVNRSENLLDLIKNENKKHSSLNVAVRYNNQEFVRFLIQEFQQDAKSLKQLLLFQDFDGNNALGLAVYLDISVAENLICIAKTIKDNNETLKKMLLPEKYDPLRQAVWLRKVHFVEMLISVAKDIDDDKYTLKQMLLKDLMPVSVLHTAAVGGNGDIIKLLLETAASLGKDVLAKLVFAINKDGKNAIHLMVDYFHEDIFADSFKIPEEDSYRNIREKVMEMFNSISEEKKLRVYKNNLIFSIKCDMINDVKSTLDSATNFKINRNEKLKNLLLAVDNEESRLNTLQIACVNGNLKIIKELISYAININDGGTTLKQLLTSTSIVNETPFEMLKFGYNSEIKQIIESLILESISNNKEHAANILQEINDKYAEVNSTSLEYALLPCNDSAHSGRLLVFTFNEPCERIIAQERNTFKFFG